jgi:hypothetical protein
MCRKSDRHHGWAVIVCLVGGGQEIHTGEAGIGAWVDACATRFPHWRVCMYDRLVEDEYGGGEPLLNARGRERTELFSDLHLTVSLRSPRGDVDDPTRSPAFYDKTFEYLKSLGLEVI